MNSLERLWKKISINKKTGCWEWFGTKNNGGYAKATINGKTHLVHRWIYINRNGEIKEGLQLDHLCRTRHCVNPCHLEPVTCRENILRGVSPLAKNAVKTHCPKGHEYSKDNTYKYPDGRRRCISCRKISDNQDHRKILRRDHKRRMRALGLMK